MTTTTLPDPCPLNCGRKFHGLPRQAYGSRPDCPGPWDATPKAPEQEGCGHDDWADPAGKCYHPTCKDV